MPTHTSTWKGTWHYLIALIAMNIQAPLALRISFLMQMIFMLLNNLVYFTVWWIFFAKFKTINGWGVHEMEAVYAITAGCYGLNVILAGGSRQLAPKISNGDLDAYLVQPKNPLLSQVGSLSQPAGWGDLITAVILLYMSGYGTWSNLPLILLLIICGAAIMSASAILLNCMAFWLGPVEQLARQFFEFVITFSVYPQTIFPIAFKVILFTVIPAAYIGFLPVTILKGAEWWWLALLIGATIFYVGLAQWVFIRGLRRYESGNRIS